MDKSIERPAGITILSGLYFLGGTAIIIMLLIFSGDTKPVDNSGMSLSANAIKANFFLLGIWSIAAADGQWTGKKWGWWLGSMYLVYSVFRSANAIRIISDLAEQIDVSNKNFTLSYIKYSGRIIFHSLITLYYFDSDVLAYFGLPQERKWMRFAQMAASSLGVAVGMIVITAFL